MLTVLLTLLTLSSPSTQDAQPTQVEAATLGSTRNVHRTGDLWFAGQFQPADIAKLSEQKIARVITLRADGEVTWDEPGQLATAGIDYVAVPFQAPESLTTDVFVRVRDLLSNRTGPTLFHCGSANRVGATWLPYRVLDQGIALDEAIREAEEIGLRTPAYKAKALAYIAAEQARTKVANPSNEVSVNPGINDNFKDDDLDVPDFVARFEVESREVYAARHAILSALAVTPGMHIADIGAGTGLFSFPLANTTGPEGWIYAIDIAPRFLEHIRSTASANNTPNIGTVLCPDSAIGLPPNSIDLAFVCDTYHHFEYPTAVVTSIRRALRPNGRLVVIDFNRIPGESSEWILNHVRASKEVFRSEIENAGLTFQRQVSVPGLSDNYYLEFQKAPHSDSSAK